MRRDPALTGLIKPSIIGLALGLIFAAPVIATKSDADDRTRRIELQLEQSERANAVLIDEATKQHDADRRRIAELERKLRERPSPVPAPTRASRSRRSSTASSTPVEIPTLLKRIRSCESGPNGYATHGWAFDFDYTATNPASTASGAYQFLNGTWRAASGLPGRAKDYPPAVQDRVALAYYRKEGTTPWIASRACWGR